MFCTDGARRVGGYRGVLEGAEDYDLWLRMSESGQLANIPQFLIDHRLHPSAYSTVGATKQLVAARLARLSAARRRGGQRDFAELSPEATTLNVASVDRATFELHGLLNRSPDDDITWSDLRILVTAVLNHNERKVAQHWLSNVFRHKKDWRSRMRVVMLLLYLHPGRAPKLIGTAWRRSDAKQAAG